MSNVNQILQLCRDRVAKELCKHPDDDWSSGYNAAIGSAMCIISSYKDYSTMRGNGCTFCRSFDFATARASVDQHGFAHIALAAASTQYPRYEQFNYCPVCGKSRFEEEEHAPATEVGAVES